MTKKQRDSAITYTALGLGIAAIIAYPAIGAIQAYWKAKSGAPRKNIGLMFEQIAATK